MNRLSSTRNFSLAPRCGRRFQPMLNTHHPERPRDYNTDPTARNLLPKHRKLIENDDWNELNKERTRQNLHSFANIWPEYSDNGWQYHTPPILPNWTPLPGRVTDNQKRWVQETTVLCPWFQDLYDEWLESRSGGEKTEQMRYEEEAVKKLCSAAYQYKYKKTLLKIMAMPLMEHETDIFNDAVRVCALTIDIREHQDELYFRTKESRGIFRHTVILYKQRQYVLQRLRRNNFKLYCKTLKHLNIEHHSQPEYNTICRVDLAMRVVDMKLRVMHHIETEVVRNSLLRAKMSELQLEGEELFEKDKDDIRKTNKIVEKIEKLKNEIDDMIPKIQEEMVNIETHVTNGSEKEQFLESYLDLMRQVNALNSRFSHSDEKASTVARLTKEKNMSQLTAKETLDIVQETLETTEEIYKSCKKVTSFISNRATSYETESP